MTDVERWVTAEEVASARERLIAAMPGFELPVAYTLARVEPDGFVFAHVNEVGGTHALPGVVLATVSGYRSGNATVPFTSAEVAAAIELLKPAEACAAFEHPNLWSWVALLAESDDDAEFVAVFISDLAAAPTTESEAALRERLRSPRLAVGTAVSLERRKWLDRPHYRHRGTVIGEDQHGVWIAVHPQPFYRGDEFAFEATAWAAQLVPHEGGWWAAFLPSGGAFDLYVDIGTAPEWDATHVSMIDLDLDVVRFSGRSVEIVDQDEFAANARDYAYPSDIVSATQESAARILRAVQQAEAPFDATGRRWLDRVLTRATAIGG
jgi:uncharacterized protein